MWDVRGPDLANAMTAAEVTERLGLQKEIDTRNMNSVDASAGRVFPVSGFASPSQSEQRPNRLSVKGQRWFQSSNPDPSNVLFSHLSPDFPLSDYFAEHGAT